MFHKVGDAQPIKNIIDVQGEEQICPYCDQPFVSIAFDENNDINLVCQCTTPDIDELAEILDEQ